VLKTNDSYSENSYIRSYSFIYTPPLHWLYIINGFQRTWSLVYSRL